VREAVGMERSGGETQQGISSLFFTLRGKKEGSMQRV
jgi:hypothetical protein